MQIPSRITVPDDQCMQIPRRENENGSDKYNIVIISDLHMVEGPWPKLRKKDVAQGQRFQTKFERFISHLESESERCGRKWKLIIAGDMVDFLQVTRVPNEPVFDLRKSEREYGLGTSPDKTAWKMKLMMNDNRRFFQAFGRFLIAGNKCVIISGNHDIEWTVPDTQYAFRQEMLKYLPDQNRQQDKILDHTIEFCPWFYYEPGLIWVEHGHQYDGMNSFDYLFAPYLPFSKELMLPVGSLMVRYLLNQLKKKNYYEYDFKSALDYIRKYFFSFFCSSNLVKHICNFPHILNKVGKFKDEDLVWLKELNELRLRAEAIRFGIDEDKLRMLKRLWVPSALYNQDRLGNLKSFVTYNVGNIWRKMATMIQRQLEVQYVVFGHTHRAESLLLTPDGSAQYANSGAWSRATGHISGNGRRFRDRHLMYVQISRDEDDKLALMRWREDALQGVPMNRFSHASCWI